MGYNVILFTAEKGATEERVIRLLPTKKKVNIGVDDSWWWGKDVYKYIKRNYVIVENDIILVTGGPFGQFLPLVKLKKEYPLLKFIVDYRDPFANNPRFKSFVKQLVKGFFERFINKMADTVIVMNPECEKLLVGKANSIIIDNGFDERAYINNVYIKNNNTIIYTGKIYPETNPNVLLTVVENYHKDICFEYIGSSYIETSHSRVKCLGFKSYNEVISITQKATIGVILTNGDAFQSTTKIFDYMASRLKILIITNGLIKTGNLHAITSNNPNVEWANNEYNSIYEALDRLYNREYQEWDYSIYARKEGLKKLIAILS